MLFTLLRDATLAAPTGSAFTLAHDMLELHGVYPYPDSRMPLMAYSDWLHIVFRLHRQLLELARRLEIGGLFLTLKPLKEMALAEKYALSLSHMDFGDKQCFEGKLTSQHVSLRCLFATQPLYRVSVMPTCCRFEQKLSFCSYFTDVFDTYIYGSHLKKLQITK